MRGNDGCGDFLRDQQILPMIKNLVFLGDSIGGMGLAVNNESRFAITFNEQIIRLPGEYQ